MDKDKGRTYKLEEKWGKKIIKIEQKSEQEPMQKRSFQKKSKSWPIKNKKDKGGK